MTNIIVNPTRVEDGVVIDTTDRIKEDIEEFRLDCLDQEKNFTISKLKLTRDPETEEPRLFYSQQLIRNFKDDDDPLNRKMFIKAFTPSNVDAAYDTTLDQKYTDSLLAFKSHITDYNPLSDIHSQEMRLFMDEETATFMSDSDVSIDALKEDFLGIESVSATPYHVDLGYDVTKLKKELSGHKSKMASLKLEMQKGISNGIDLADLNGDEFESLIAKHQVSSGLVQTYLSLKERINSIKARIGELNDELITDTRLQVRLPRLRSDSYAVI